MSESVQLSFGFIGEFNLNRSSENGFEHWGEAIYCDHSQYFPDIQYYWVCDVFPYFVEEDSRSFVSFDGNLYFPLSKISTEVATLATFRAPFLATVVTDHSPSKFAIPVTNSSSILIISPKVSLEHRVLAKM